jgi:hypothetical protein
VPKSYEDEIRDLLKGMDRFPGEGQPREGQPRRAPQSQRRWSAPSIGGLARLNPQRMMGAALILVLFSYILQGRWLGNYPVLALLAGWISLASIVLFVFALVLFIRGRGGMGMSMGGRPNDVRWRGQVIELRPRNSGVSGWWRRLTRRFQRGPRSRGPRGRDSFQW